MKELAVVTGATGMVGKRIVTLLLQQGFPVRVLTRNKAFVDSRVEIIYGDLEDVSTIERLLLGAKNLFHCAAELNDENKMWGSNVTGTQVLIDKAAKFGLDYICHLSSVGVIGKFRGELADESTECSPMNLYEKSKLQAETLMKNFRGSGRVIILRPTNVIDSVKNNISSLNRVTIFLKGGENAHIVHAEDVASAALFFLNTPSLNSPDCFIVSCDQNKLNTFAGCKALCDAIKIKSPREGVRPIFHMPWQFPYILRRVTKGPCNRGNVRYSSNKLLSTGFIFPLGFIGALEDICENSKC